MEWGTEASASLHSLRRWLQTTVAMERRKFWLVRTVRHEGRLGNALKLQLSLCDA
jgi:hypothetical protein